MKDALIAVVGEPNVGKSTLINKVIQERIALTSPVAGTTRDRFYVPTSWNGIDFTLVDTAGIILEQKDELEQNVQKQVDVALKEADMIVYMLDGKKDSNHFNRAILQKIRKSKKNTVLVINKIDSPKKFKDALEAYRFTGIKQIFPISSISGLRIGDLLDGITDYLKEKGFANKEKDDAYLKVSFIGKPNVGKSSLFNQIIGEERVVVSSVPGTTRNVVDTEVKYKDKVIRFLDTAGLKRREKKAELPDIYAAFQTLKTIHKSDICILVIDSNEGITQQDQRVANEIVDAGKGLIIAANKVDLLKPETKKKLQDKLSQYFPFLWWAPAVQVSAKSGEGVKDMLDYLIEIKETRFKKIDPQVLTEFFFERLKRRPPQRIRDERVPRIFSIKQVSVNPPVFKMMVNKPSAISMQFRKYIQNEIIKELGFWGTPIQLKLETKKGNPNSDFFNYGEEEE